LIQGCNFIPNPELFHQSIPFLFLFVSALATSVLVTQKPPSILRFKPKQEYFTKSHNKKIELKLQEIRKRGEFGWLENKFSPLYWQIVVNRIQFSGFGRWVASTFAEQRIVTWAVNIATLYFIASDQKQKNNFDLVELGLVAALWSGFATVVTGYYLCTRLPVFQVCEIYPLIMAGLGMIYFDKKHELPHIFPEFFQTYFGIELPYFFQYFYLISIVVLYNLIRCIAQFLAVGQAVNVVISYSGRLMAFLAGNFVAFNAQCREELENLKGLSNS